MSLQTLIDAREDLNIRAYEVWQGWAQQHALAEIEQRFRDKGVGEVVQEDRFSLFAAVALLLGVLAIGFGLIR